MNKLCKFHYFTKNVSFIIEMVCIVTDIDECAANADLCLNDGTCINTDGSFHCQCLTGYTGITCESGETFYSGQSNGLRIELKKLSLDVDECMTQPCENDGQCTNSVGSFSCACTPQWSGKLCQTGNNVLLVS